MQELFSDISELFVFDEADIDYLDGPLSGWLRSKQDGSWFAYDCQPIIDGFLYHWTIVPASQKTDVAEVFREAAKANTGRWLTLLRQVRAGCGFPERRSA
jgi:hypothetical protein